MRPEVIAPDEIVPILERLREASTNCVPLSCNTVPAPAKLTTLADAVRKVLEIVPILVRLPDASIRCVPPVAPVLIPVVPLSVVPVIVLAVAIVPKPEAIEPDVRMPTPVNPDVPVNPVPAP